MSETTHSRDNLFSEEIETDEEKAARLSQEEYMEALRHVLSSYKGRLVIWKLLELTNMFHAPPSHEQETFRFIGRGDVGRDFMMDIEDAQTGAFAKIYREANKREKERYANVG